MKAKGRILIIEDSPGIADIVRLTLTKKDYSVLSVRDGQSGLIMAREHPPDLVVLDIALPGGMDALAILNMLRGESLVPVLVLAAPKVETDRIVRLKRRANDYIIKPFTRKELGARVDAILRRSGSPYFVRVRQKYEGRK